MKKIFSLLLVICVLISAVSLSSCGNQPRKTLIKNAIEKTEKLKSVEQRMTITMTMSVNGVSVEIPIKAHIKGKNLDTSKPTLYEQMTVTAMGERVSVTMYADADWVYINQGTAKYKMSLEDAEEVSTDIGKDAESMLLLPPDDALKTATDLKYQDGRRVVKVEFDGEQFEDTYADLIDMLEDTSGMGDFDVKEGTIEITVKDGYILRYDMDFTMTAKIEGGQKMDVRVDADLEIVDPGEKVDVKIPDEYKKFPQQSID
ncbi:MAG: hypothetical protein IJW16_06030 [Clostridia bacterium]|nr:hypothetical protein [Clostridia bacterium]